MSTFVLRFLGDPLEEYRGRVRHVETGEEVLFSSLQQMLAFLDQMNALPHRDLHRDPWNAIPPTDETKPQRRRRR